MFLANRGQFRQLVECQAVQSRLVTRMLTRSLRPQGNSIEKGEWRRLSDAEAAHLDMLLDDALRETFPASDPIAICIDTAARNAVRNTNVLARHHTTDTFGLAYSRSRHRSYKNLG